MSDTKKGAGKPIEPAKSNVVFTPEQLELIQQMMASARQSGEQSKKGAEVPSMFTDVVDPKSIRSVPVYRFDAKFVIGFKDLNNDPYREQPRYYEMKININRRTGMEEPFVTLLLSTNGEDVIEKEVPLIDYLNHRVKTIQEDFEIVSKDVIEDHGIIGRVGSDMALDIDAKDRMVTPLKVKAETKGITRKFIVNLPGFSKPVEFLEAFMA